MFSVTYLQEDGISDQNCGQKKLYDFIFAYEMSENKDDVIEALKPHCFVKAASFYRQTMGYDTSGKRQYLNVFC